MFLMLLLFLIPHGFLLVAILDSGALCEDHPPPPKKKNNTKKNTDRFGPYLNSSEPFLVPGAGRARSYTGGAGPGKDGRD